MQIGRIGLMGAMAGVVLGGLVAAAGCDGADDAVSGGDESELHGGSPFRHRHPRPDAGGVGGTSGGAPGTGAPATDCDICTQAQQCCEVLPGQPTCTFTAATCASQQGEARAAHVNACLTFVVSVRGVWGGNPPAECR